MERITAGYGLVLASARHTVTRDPKWSSLFRSQGQFLCAETVAVAEQTRSIRFIRMMRLPYD